MSDLPKYALELKNRQFSRSGPQNFVPIRFSDDAGNEQFNDFDNRGFSNDPNDIISGNTYENSSKESTEADKLREIISDLEDQIARLQNDGIETEELEQQIDKERSNVSELSQKVDESNNKIENISQKIDESNNKTANLSQKMGNIESKVNETFTKSDENSREIGDIKEKVELIKRKNSEISTKINEGNQNLTQKIEETNNKIKNLSQKDFEMIKIFVNANNGQFNGIIRQLTNECGGNVSDKGIVNVTVSSTCWGNPRDVVNLENTGLFGTNNKQDSWIKYDFKNKKVSPVCYLIRSCNGGKNWCHPKSWVVEGSNTDSNDWKVLDSRTDCMSLNNPSAVQCFAIQQSSDFYRFLRIRQTDKNWYGNYYFTMSALEYFGFIQ